MDIKQDYREESNLDVYAEHSLNYANYTNEYVKWLEAKLTLTDVVKSFYCDDADERLAKCNKQCKDCLKLNE